MSVTTMIRPNVRRVKRSPKALRADRVTRALARYQGAAREELGQQRGRVITDLLEDLRHYCEHHHLDFAQLDRRASLNYLNETRVR